jgi:hypothetical protein
MARLSSVLTVVPYIFVLAISSRAAAEPESAAAEPAPRAPMTWHATPPAETSPSGTSTADSSAPTPNHGDEPQRSHERSDDASRAMDEGRTLPFTVGAAAPKAHADVTALGGYDSAAKQARAISTAEARLLPFLALRVEYEHGPGTGDANDRVTFGARATILTQDKYGIDLGAGFFFQPTDFRGEGDFVGAITAGRSFGRWGVFCNALVGVDSEGDDGSAEVRLSSTYRATKQLHLGFDARARYNFSDDDKRFSEQQVNWEVQAGPLASLALGPVGLMAIVGPSALRLTEPGASGKTALGAVAMGGAAAVF